MSRWWALFGPHVRPHAGRISALFALAGFGVALEALLPWPLKLVVDSVLAGRELPPAAAWIQALPAAQTPVGLLAWLALGVLLVFLTYQALQLLKTFVQADVAARMQAALAAGLFVRLQELAPTYHRRARVGDLVRRVTVDTQCLPTLVTGVVVPVFTSLLALGVFFAIMWRLDPVLTVCAALVALPMGVLMRLLGPRLSERAYEHHSAEGEVWSVAEQTLTAIPVVQAFAGEEAQTSRFRSVAGRSIRAYVRSLRTQIQFRVGVDASEALGVAIVMLIGGFHVIEGSLSIGSLIVFLSYLAALYAPLVTLAYLASTVGAAAGSARRVAEVLDADERVPETPDEPAPAGKVCSSAARRIPGGRDSARVRLDGVVFGYRPGQPVLHGADLELHTGETVALIGPSGAGKSTLAALIPRLYDPWEGSVTIGGTDVRRMALASVRERVSLVLQDPFLLPLTIAENIAYGRPSASRAQIEDAAKRANADAFIRDLPHGYDTVIGERGVTLSGGQRQRLAIARALLKDAPILIMDEPTSALDAATEHAVMEAVERLRAGRTTLVIAHRLSTTRHAERVVVLERGRIVESGSHAELLAQPGLYQRLVRMQYEWWDGTPRAATRAA